MFERCQAGGLAPQIYVHFFEAVNLRGVLLAHLRQLRLHGRTSLRHAVILLADFGGSLFELVILSPERVELRVEVFVGLERRLRTLRALAGRHLEAATAA